MRVLIVGNGGREHALAWAIAQSPSLTRLFVAPGNPGLASLATCLSISPTAVDELVAAALDRAIDLVVVGPEAPLALGLVDRLAAAGILAFGPRQQAAQIESSKTWAKEFMARQGIPTAAYRIFDDYEGALAYIRTQEFPQVIKASGLAAGKGAVVVDNLAEAEATLASMLVEQSFGAAGAEVVVEAFLEGEEITLMALVAGESYLLLPPAQDHKQIFEGDRGPNTGGMGAYSPVPLFGEKMQAQTLETIILPTLRGLRREGIDFRGLLYFGLMLTPAGPQVIEYNARFGDPETQVVLPRLQGDILELLRATAQGNLQGRELKVSPEICAAVIMAAPGYPGPYKKGLPIRGIEKAQALGCLVFQAGTAEGEAGLESRGGRILAVAGRAPDLARALRQAYAGVEMIDIPEVYYRRDIAYQALGYNKKE